MAVRKSNPAKKAPTGKRQNSRAARAQHAPELVIITGMSGSGKASVLKAFEDLGYYCVDNLPVELIPRFAELAMQSGEIRRTALVVDVRAGAAARRQKRRRHAGKQCKATKIIGSHRAPSRATKTILSTPGRVGLVSFCHPNQAQAGHRLQISFFG